MRIPSPGLKTLTKKWRKDTFFATDDGWFGTAHFIVRWDSGFAPGKYAPYAQEPSGPSPDLSQVILTKADELMRLVDIYADLHDVLYQVATVGKAIALIDADFQRFIELARHTGIGELVYYQSSQSKIITAQQYGETVAVIAPVGNLDEEDIDAIVQTKLALYGPSEADSAQQEGS